MAGKNRFAFFEGGIVPIDEARVGIMTSALHYGTGVFEGIRAYWNEDDRQLYVFRLREHYERFLANCRILWIDLPQTPENLSEITLDLLRREGFKKDTYIRPVAYKSSPEVGVRLHDLDSECAIFAIPFGEYIPAPDGARLTVSSWRRIDDNSIPARGKINGAYVNSALAKTEAHEKGFDDALMLSGDGHVSEASAANLFVVRNGMLVTPPETDDILAGITRSTIIEFARDLGIPVVERSIDRSELFMAEDAFLVGTGASVVPIAEVDHRPVGDGKPGTLAVRFRHLYLDTVRGKIEKYRHWCTPVYV